MHGSLRRVTRREFVTITMLCAALSCTRSAAERRSGPGRLNVRIPAACGADLLPAGRHALGLGKKRDGVLYVPSHSRGSTTPLVVLLHGGTGSAAGITTRTNAFALADELGVAILAPDSRATTWDAVDGYLGPDVDFVDRALEHAFARVAVDPRRIAIGGFSDGASYALTLGLINGDLFTHVMAFSPGFIMPKKMFGRPALFVSHGTRDDILPVATTSRIVYALEKSGYRVRYREFDGPHTVPPALVREAFEWVAGRG